MDFRSFNFAPAIFSAIEKQGYTEPTPIQLQAIPEVLSGRDLVGLAQTGTGKTAAYVLPLLERLQANPRRGLRGLIISPTRELAEQINDVIKTFGAGMRIRSATVYGGVSMSNQIRAIKSGVNIIVACPGRLLDHIQQRTIDLREVEMLVLDEADQMFDMGFLPGIRRIAKHLPQQRQTLLFSATMPDEIRSIANELLTDPKTIKVGESRPAETISHAMIAVGNEQKHSLLLELLKGTSGSALVFTRTKHQAKRLAQKVASAGIRTTDLQGNLSQNKRQQALDGFRQGRFRVLVATDVAARGIDISLIEQVINYDIPSTPEAYTHRIGRTGRANQTGIALTFVAREDIKLLRLIERSLGKPIERKIVEGFDAGFTVSAEAPREGRPQGERRQGQRNGRPWQQNQRGRKRSNGANGDRSFRFRGERRGNSRANGEART